MKRLIAFAFVVICVLGLVGCQKKPDTPADIHVDKVSMSRSSDGGASSEAVTITDKETISELLAMHNSMRTKEKSEPIADEHIWIQFYQDNENILEWCISAYGVDWAHARLITCSTALDIGNHVVESDFDYNRVIEIFNESMD